MTKIPIYALIQAIGQHSIEEYEAYYSVCQEEYEKYRGHSNYRKRHYQQELMEVAERLCDLRCGIYQCAEAREDKDQS